MYVTVVAVATFKIEAADLYRSQDKLKNLKERFKWVH